MKQPHGATSCGLLACLLADARAPEAPFPLLIWACLLSATLVMAGDEDAPRSHFLRLMCLPFG